MTSNYVIVTPRSVPYYGVRPWPVVTSVSLWFRVMYVLTGHISHRSDQYKTSALALVWKDERRQSLSIGSTDLILLYEVNWCFVKLGSHGWLLKARDKTMHYFFNALWLVGIRDVIQVAFNCKYWLVYWNKIDVAVINFFPLSTNNWSWKILYFVCFFLNLLKCTYIIILSKKITANSCTRLLYF